MDEDPERYESWSDYLVSGDDEDGTYELIRATYICNRCGVVVSQCHTRQHDQFHAQLEQTPAPAAAFNEARVGQELEDILSFFEVNTYHGSRDRLKSRLMELVKGQIKEERK